MATSTAGQRMCDRLAENIVACGAGTEITRPMSTSRRRDNRMFAGVPVPASRATCRPVSSAPALATTRKATASKPFINEANGADKSTDNLFRLLYRNTIQVYL